MGAQERRALPARQPFAWRITRAGDGTLYLVVARRSERGRIGDADDGALYRSTDGAEHWTRMTLPAGTNGPNGLTVDPPIRAGCTWPPGAWPRPAAIRAAGSS